MKKREKGGKGKKRERREPEVIGTRERVDSSSFVLQ